MKERKSSAKIENQGLKYRGKDLKSKRRRRRYADLFDFAPVGCFTFDRSGIILDVNSAGALMLGTDKQRLLNQNFSQFISPNFQKVFDFHHQQLFKTRKKHTCDLKLLKNSEKVVWVQLESLAVENGGGASEQFRTVAKEITDRKQAQEALRSQRDNLMNILDSMGDGVTIIDQKYDIEYANPTLIREFGPLNGRKCYEYLANRNSICSYCKNEEVFAGKTVHWQWYSPKNKRIYDLMDTPLTNPDGGVWKLEIFRDITEYKQAEEELRQARDELEQRVAERTAELEKINKKLRRQIFECLHAEAALRESEHNSAGWSKMR